MEIYSDTHLIRRDCELPHCLCPRAVDVESHSSAGVVDNNLSEFIGPWVRIQKRNVSDSAYAQSMVTAGVTANTMDGNSRTSWESGLLCSHAHVESIVSVCLCLRLWVRCCMHIYNLLGVTRFRI